MAKTKLFDGKATRAQQLIVGAWYANLIVVLIIWATTSASLITSGGAGGIALAFGRLFGLLAATFALTQFLLMGRILWIERPFGLDHLASYHRFNGYAAIIAILIHAPLVVLGYALSSHTNYFAQYSEVILHYQDTWKALIAEILFVTVVVSSIYIVRRKLKFESWYFVHLIVYAAIVLAFAHQLAIGGSFLDHPLARLYWLAIYVFVGVSVLFWRFTLPSLNMIRFNFRIARVERETATTTSVFISGKKLKKWSAKPGQFVLVRFLEGKFALQEHPFSMSAVPYDDEFRLTIRNSGDYTSTISTLKPGSRVLVSGPFGRFTSEIAVTKKRLFIAGGVGITPLRTLITEALAAKQDCVLLYGNRSTDDVVFQKELTRLEKVGLKIHFVYSDPPKGFSGETGYIDGPLIERLVPDFVTRDIYLCGPPPMMDSVIAAMEATKLPHDQLHYERFSLHS